MVVVDVDEDFLEDGEIEEPAEVARDGLVGLVAAFKEFEEACQVGACCGVLVGEAGEVSLDGGQGFGDAVLFGLEELERDCVGVVGLEQALAFSLELVLFQFEVLPVLDAVAAGRGDLLQDGVFDALTV
ncbi:hypothetical protein [Arthrobacter woluwensis]|uniref:hypothetical protein n=1 Tax=Arthrobacter woluwensis TaxID=156980 RepID=UPI0011A0C9D7|nr:hypothetical protein [Arthrobacter woluwensis]